MAEVEVLNEGGAARRALDFFTESLLSIGGVLGFFTESLLSIGGLLSFFTGTLLAISDSFLRRLTFSVKLGFRKLLGELFHIHLGAVACICY